MKWFKHYVDASRSEKLNVLMDEFGVDGYGKYWLLVELLAEKFDGSNAEFRVHKATLKRSLRVHHDKMLLKWLRFAAEIKLMSWECDDNVFIIYFPKLLELKDNHTRNLQVTSKPVGPRTEQNRIDKTRVLKTEISEKASKPKKLKIDIEPIYNAYPKKQGKSAGMKKLQSIINSPEIYNTILHAAENYARFIKNTDTEKKYVKQFSTWVNQECWNDELEVPASKEELDAKLIELFNTRVD